MKKFINILSAAVLVINTAVPVCTAQAAESKELFTYDFTQMSSVPKNVTHAGSSHSKSTVVIAGDDNTNVLKWTQSDRTENKNCDSTLQITPDAPVEVTYPITIEYSAKIDKNQYMTNFLSLRGTDAGGNDVTAQYGLNRWCTVWAFHISKWVKTDGTKVDNFSPLNNIKYNGSNISALKYYVHRYIINADGTYKYYIKEDSANSAWEEPFADGTLSITGSLPSKITSLYSLAGFFNGNADNFTESEEAAMKLDASQYIKYVKIEKYRLELEETNIPDGENPVFGEKTIRLKFNMPVNENTLSNAIELYNGENKVNDIELKTDNDDKRIVYVKMTDFPEYNTTYELRINDAVNKNADGYVGSLSGYGKTFKFHNVQQSNLAVKTTTPANGEEFSEKKISVKFSGSVSLASAKENVKVYKGTDELVYGTDYTLSLNENDETLMYISLIAETANGTDFSVTISKNINSGKTGYAVFPEGTDDYTFSFTIVKDPGKQTITLDSEKMTEAEALGALSDKNGASLYTDGESKSILIQKESSTETRHNISVSVGKSIDITKGPVTVEFTVKLPLTKFEVKVDDISAYAGIINWDWTDMPRISGWYENGSEFKDGKDNIGAGNATSKYYTYRYDIDYAANKITASSKKEDGDSFSTVGVGTLPLNAKNTVIEKLNFSFSTGPKAPNVELSLKSINITQTTVPSVTSQTVADNAADVADDLQKITFLFNAPILNASFNKENISVFQIIHGEEKAVDALYEIIPNSDQTGFDIKFNSSLGMDNEYVVKIKNLAADTVAQGSMTAEESISFKTAKKYDIETPSVAVAGKQLTVSGNVKTYYKASKENFVVIAALMDNDGKFTDVVYEKKTALEAASGFKDNSYSLLFNIPDGFNANKHKVKIYVFNAVQNSENLCAPVEVALGN